MAIQQHIVIQQGVLQLLKRGNANWFIVSFLLIDHWSDTISSVFWFHRKVCFACVFSTQPNCLYWIDNPVYCPTISSCIFLFIKKLSRYLVVPGEFHIEWMPIFSLLSISHTTLFYEHTHAHTSTATARVEGPVSGCAIWIVSIHKYSVLHRKNCISVIQRQS